MFDWLFEGRTSVYVYLGVAALILFIIWYHLGGPWQPWRRTPQREETRTQKPQGARPAPTATHYGRGFKPLLESVDVPEPRKKRLDDSGPGREGLLAGPRLHFLLLAAVMSVALMGGYWLLSGRVETDRTTLELTVKKMAACVAQKNLDFAFDHISERFRSPTGKTKEMFRSLAQRAMESGEVKAVELWSFEFPERPDRERETRVNFMFKLKGDHEGLHFLCESVFVHEPDGVWRMLRCRILDPFHKNEEIDLAGF